MFYFRNCTEVLDSGRLKRYQGVEMKGVVWNVRLYFR